MSKSLRNRVAAWKTHERICTWGNVDIDGLIFISIVVEQHFVKITDYLFNPLAYIKLYLTNLFKIYTNICTITGILVVTQIFLQ